MTPPLSPVNIAAFALQVLVIVGAGALLLRAFRIDAPRAVLAYWRILLLAIEQKIRRLRTNSVADDGVVLMILAK